MIDNAKFCKVFTSMANEGKTALEIGKALGIEKDDDKKVSQAVSQQATTCRKLLREGALAKAAKQGLSEDAAKALADKVEATLPRLKKGKNAIAGELGSYIDDLMAACDTPPEEGEVAPEAETENTPE